MKAFDLRTEYLTKPLGIDCPKPVLSWKCEEGIQQTAYQLIARCGSRTILDTGKASSAEMNTILLPDEPLQSRQKIDWSLRLWDEKDQPGEWSHSSFEMGLLTADDWQAKWISAYRERLEKKHQPVDYFRKRFIAADEVLSARLYATARGVFDVEINQHLLTDAVLAPGFFDFNKQIFVQAYDITPYLQASNTCIIRLADGYYKGHIGSVGADFVYGLQTSCLLQIEFTYKNGETQVVGTDSSWDWCCDGPLRSADLLNGEIHDETFIPSYVGHAMEIPAPDVPLKWMEHEPLQMQETETPAQILPLQIFDFGHTVTGFLRLTVPANAGKRFTVFLGDRLNEKGFIDLTNLQTLRPAVGWNRCSAFLKKMGLPFAHTLDVSPRQEIHITCANHEFVYQTSFSLFTFRYAQIVGDLSANDIEVEAIPVRSGLKKNAVFHSDNSLLNSLFENAVRTVENTIIDYPVCNPLRGRTGELLPAAQSQSTVACLFEDAAFQRKWLKDLANAQQEDGSFPVFVPNQGLSFVKQVDYGIICCMLVWRLYLHTNNACILHDFYPMIERYAAYLLQQAGQTTELSEDLNKSLYRWKGLIPKDGKTSYYQEHIVDPLEFGTAYFFEVMRQTTQIADALKKDSTAYQQAAEYARTAYRALYGRGGHLNNVPMEQLIRAIFLHLLESDEEKAAVQVLLDRIKQETSGLGHTAMYQLLQILNDNDQNKLALALIERPDYPGYTDQIARGATTCWENWDGSGERCSIGAASITYWIITGLVGLRLQTAQHYTWKPSFAVPRIDFSMDGIHVSWDENGEIALHIPPSVTLELRLPDQDVQTLSAGEFKFSYHQT